MLCVENNLNKMAYVMFALHSTRAVQKYYHGHVDISKSNNLPFLVTLKLLYSAEIQLQFREETKG